MPPLQTVNKTPPREETIRKENLRKVRPESWTSDRHKDHKDSRSSWGFLLTFLWSLPLVSVYKLSCPLSLQSHCQTDCPTAFVFYSGPTSLMSESKTHRRLYLWFGFPYFPHLVYNQFFHWASQKSFLSIFCIYKEVRTSCGYYREQDYGLAETGSDESHDQGFKHDGEAKQRWSIGCLTKPLV